MTWYHKFTEKFHVAFEAYTLSQRNVLNITDPAGIIAAGGYPFAPGIMQFNAPNFAHCSDHNVITCTASVVTAVAYWNYKVTPLDNISLRTEYYHDEQGQRTSVATRYAEVGLGWQHWFSPQIEIRPEVSFYRSLNAPAFNGNANFGIAPNKSNALIGSADIIIHF
jgi:hypothetical protein